MLALWEVGTPGLWSWPLRVPRVLRSGWHTVYCAAGCLTLALVGEFNSKKTVAPLVEAPSASNGWRALQAILFFLVGRFVLPPFLLPWSALQSLGFLPPSKKHGAKTSFAVTCNLRFSGVGLFWLVMVFALQTFACDVGSAGEF